VINAFRHQRFLHTSATSTPDRQYGCDQRLSASKIFALSETLANLQRMERVSYGLDDAGGGKTEIIIERSYGVLGPGVNGAGELL